MSIIRQALKKHNPKADPLGGEMSQRDREGRLALKLRLPHNQRTYPSDCKAGAREKAVPLGGRGTAPAVEGGNSLTNIDCPPTSPPSPTHRANKTAPNPKGHTTPQASSPPPSPNGPTSHPKGEAKLRTAKQEPKESPPPWGKVAGVSLTEGGNSLSILDCPQPRHPTQRTHPKPPGGPLRRPRIRGKSRISHNK